jgi:hypothetical protein
MRVVTRRIKLLEVTLLHAKAAALSLTERQLLGGTCAIVSQVLRIDFDYDWK